MMLALAILLHLRHYPTSAIVPKCEGGKETAGEMDTWPLNKAAVSMCLAAGAVVAGVVYHSIQRYSETRPLDDELDTSLMQRHTVYKPFHVNGFVYRLRVVYVPRSKAERLSMLPLICFVHG